MYRHILDKIYVLVHKQYCCVFTVSSRAYTLLVHLRRVVRRPTAVKLTVLTVACPVQIRWKNVLSVRHAFHVCFICSLSVTSKIFIIFGYIGRYLSCTSPYLCGHCEAIVQSLCVLSVPYSVCEG